MTQLEMKTFIRKYRTMVMAIAVIAFTLMALGVIWYIRSASGPLAPTAPSSRPRAAANICSLEFEIPMECTSITPTPALSAGASITFQCAGLAGADRYVFSYRASSGATWTVFADGTSATSPALTIGDYADVRCMPCAGDYCAPEANVASKCTVNYVAPTPTPTPSPTPTPTPTPTPSPSPSPVPQCNSICSQNSECPSSMTCSGGYCRNPQCTESTSCTCTQAPKAAFIIEKFNDRNGDGVRGSSEGGLSWEFEWQLNSDGNWRKYQTYSNQSGRGGTVGDLSSGDVVTIREMDKEGWEHTTATEVSLTMELGQTKKASFGNRQPTTPGVTPTPIVQVTPSPIIEEQLPEAGSTSQTMALLAIGGGVLFLGGMRWHLLHKKQ
jgi:hypothetical protein